ncbi:aldolase catalytic domain-containing protein [Hungatella hathewayi]|uniref:aldolase catalytic domain-containing protein n=1 Tax=Hungatella hathewayi TaxID=154046 RepID=UPI003569B6FE
MKMIRVLDCTLRDGGRIIDCRFPDNTIKAMAGGLTEAGIDIVELGFLRDGKKVDYRGNSTFFTDVDQIRPFLPEKASHTMYAAFIDYGMFDFNTLKPYDSEAVDGLRVGFTKNDLTEHKEDIRKSLLTVKDKGYKLLIQGVNSLAYSEKELLDLLDLVNEIQPYSFGIVDTYGAMYLEDFTRIYNLVDNNLKETVCIDIHSHNNFQLSFAFAQEAVKMREGTRCIIFDATLAGMGKCAGNLNTELITDYLNRKKNFNYDLETLLDLFDEYLYPIREKLPWGYSIPAFMAGIYKAHPNNVIYLTERFRLDTKGVKNILSLIDEDKRQRYDYDNIQRIYRDYSAAKIDDREVLERLKPRFQGRSVLLLVPGHTLLTQHCAVKRFIDEERPVVMTVGFEAEAFVCDYIFYANERRCKKVTERRTGTEYIICSNITERAYADYVVDYYKLLGEGSQYFDNSTVMAMNLLRRLEVTRLFLAGFDGFDEAGENFIDNSFYNDRFSGKFDEMNEGLELLLTNYQKHNGADIRVSFLTESRFEKIFEDDENG